MNEQMIESKKAVAMAIADEKKLEREAGENKRQSEDWEKKAMLAVRSNRDDLAKEALLRKQEYEGYATQLFTQWQAQKDSVEKLKVSLRELQNKIDEASRKKNILIARAKRAEAQDKINKTMSSISGNKSAFDTFERMSKKVDELEARTEAAKELEDATSGATLEKQFAQLESSGGRRRRHARGSKAQDAHAGRGLRRFRRGPGSDPVKAPARALSVTIRILADREPYASILDARESRADGSSPGPLTESFVFVNGPAGLDEVAADIVVMPAVDFLALPRLRSGLSGYIVYGPVSLMDFAFKHGCTDYIREPWTMPELYARLRRLQNTKFRVGAAILSVAGTVLRGEKSSVELKPERTHLLIAPYSQCSSTCHARSCPGYPIPSVDQRIP
jgi:phage shock protein A